MSDKKSKIVLLDDSEANSTVGKNVLSTFFEVYPAPTAQEFFQILEKVTPDLILLDMELPDVGGDETIKRIKSDSRFADIPVILLSPQSGESEELEGFKLGAADCIAKPFSGPSLLKRIVKQLLVVQKDKVTAVRGKEGTEMVVKLKGFTDKKRQGGKYVTQTFKNYSG